MNTTPYWQMTPEQQEAHTTAAYEKINAEWAAKDAAKAAANDPAALLIHFQEKAQAVQSGVTNLAAYKAAQPKPAPIASDATEPYHIILAKLVIDSTRNRGGDLMFIGKTAYRYFDGLWTMDTEGITAWLNVGIEHAAQYMKKPSDNKLVNEARGWILRQKKLNRSQADVRWDAHGLVPTISGLVDPKTGAVRLMRPDDFCTGASRLSTTRRRNARGGCRCWMTALPIGRRKSATAP